MINKPEEPPAWPQRVTGFSFAPMRADYDPEEKNYPTPQEIEEDIALLAGKTVAIRTYTVEGSLAQIPDLARKYQLNVCLGAWLGEDEKANAVEFAHFIRVARQNPNIVQRIKHSYQRM